MSYNSARMYDIRIYTLRFLWKVSDEFKLFENWELVITYHFTECILPYFFLLCLFNQITQFLPALVHSHNWSDACEVIMKNMDKIGRHKIPVKINNRQPRAYFVYTLGNLKKRYTTTVGALPPNRHCS